MEQVNLQMLLCVYWSFLDGQSGLDEEALTLGPL